MASRGLIPVSAPELGAREREYVLECLDSTWISSSGEFIGRFEEAFAECTASPHAVSCNTGTAALHLALLALGIGAGDEVIVPSLTYVASVNAIRYCGATPRFVDARPDTWNLDPADVERKLNNHTRAILAVHLFGEPADVNRLRAYGVALVEDAAEALGATIGGKQVGPLGEVGTFSFYGNKLITTGEGGMVVTRDEDVALRARQLRGQGQDFERRYWFPVVGFNYRMTNIEAAIGLAQLETFESKLARRQAVAARYGENLAHTNITLQAASPDTRSAAWMVGALLPVSTAEERDAVAGRLLEAGIETRPFFYPVHTLPPYSTDEDGILPVSVELAARGLCLPTWSALPLEQVDEICEHLVAALGRRHTADSIRRLEPADTDAVTRLFSVFAADAETAAHFHPHPLDANAAHAVCRSDGADVYLGYRLHGDLVGYAMLRGWDEGYEVPTFGVAVGPDSRGRGVGAALLEECLRLARAHGASEVMLKVHPENVRAVEWYRSAGFVETGASGDGQLIFQLTLTAAQPA